MAFGDYDPEDAWDAGDTKAAHIHNLWERIELLDGGSTAVTLDDIIGIQARIAYWKARRGTLDTVASIRLDMLLDDLGTTLHQ